MVSLTAPYVSGFLAFREVPFLLELVQQLREKEPGLMPQAGGLLGSTLSLGETTSPPARSVASQVVGFFSPFFFSPIFQIRLLQTRGDSFPLLGDSGTVLGMPTGQPSPSLSQALRSHDRSTRPLYISVGHKMSLEAAVRLTCCCCRFRIPEPVRQADICSREHIRKSLGLPRPPTPRSPTQRPVACPRGDSGESSGEVPSPQRQADRTAPGGRRSTAQCQVG
uniref:Endonuclease V n=1 Tax=Mandrillus leucophaeus TaxID=9568 RepID=A0A2K5YP47_MANLE